MHDLLASIQVVGMEENIKHLILKPWNVNDKVLQGFWSLPLTTSIPATERLILKEALKPGFGPAY